MAGSGTTPHLGVRSEWLAQVSEEIIEPDLPIIDAHHHLWDRPNARYLFADFTDDVRSGHRIVATIFAQCRSMYRADGPDQFKPVGEVEFVNGLAAQSASGLYGPARLCAGIIGGADLRLGDQLAPVLEAMRARAGTRLCGIRNSTAWHASEAIRSNPLPPPNGLLKDPQFRRGVAALKAYGLSLDLWAYHTQLAEVLDLARAFPETTIVLDHLGGPLGAGPYAGKRDEVFVAWKAGMAALAALPNIQVKLGGLGMQVSGFDFQTQPLPPTSQQLSSAWKPYIATVIELFGAHRCMFESNFPVDKGMFAYHVLWNAFKRLSSSCSGAEKTALFRGTASSVYRLNA